ncbi:hypothetical protein ACEE16_10560 [Streptococcus suis]
MKLKDILEIGTYGFNPECKVEIFDMDQFEERLENEDATIYPYGFLLEDSILIAMTEESEEADEN